MPQVHEVSLFAFGSRQAASALQRRYRNIKTIFAPESAATQIPVRGDLLRGASLILKISINVRTSRGARAVLLQALPAIPVKQRIYARRAIVHYVNRLRHSAA